MEKSILVYASKALFSNTTNMKKTIKNQILENDVISAIAIS